MIFRGEKVLNSLMTRSLSPGLVAGGGDHQGQQPAFGVDGQVPASPGDLLPAVVTVSAHLTIWESTMHAVGCGLRPWRSRSRSRSRCTRASGSPRLFHRS